MKGMAVGGVVDKRKEFNPLSCRMNIYSLSAFLSQLISLIMDLWKDFVPKNQACSDFLKEWGKQAVCFVFCFFRLGMSLLSACPPLRPHPLMGHIWVFHFFGCFFCNWLHFIQLPCQIFMRGKFFLECICSNQAVTTLREAILHQIGCFLHFV